MAIKKFYVHLVMFIIGNMIILGVNYHYNYIKFPWILFGTMGWGIGLTFDYLKAFDKNPFLKEDWEERKIKELMSKED